MNCFINRKYSAIQNDQTVRAIIVCYFCGKKAIKSGVIKLHAREMFIWLIKSKYSKISTF